MWNTRALQAAGAGSGGAVGAAGGGALCAAEHVGAILDAAFSPDGSALATASADGYVMFFQVYMHADSSPRCLHKWQPHGGKPLSCLFFLDNHKNYNTDVQFWKFAVTGAENNTTIKIWSCKSWTCLQTINFTPGVGTEMTLGLKAMLDTSASYLLLSDFKSRSLYVLNMARDPEDSMAYCKSISEFLLPYPVLSFCIVDAEEQQTKCEPSCDEPLYRNGSGGDADSPIHYELHHDDSGSGGSRSEEWRRVVVRLYIVQPKGLQEGRLVYEPPRPPLHAELLHGLSELALEDSSVESAPATIASSILQQQSQQLKNLLMRSQTQPGSLIGTRPESPSIAPQLNLMTPDAFSSPGKREEDDPPLSATPDVSSKPRNSTGEMMSAQTRELRSLRGAVASPRDMIDEALHAHAQRTARAVESALADGWERISRVGEAASARAAQAAGVGAARALEPLAAALQHELANKMAATDQLLRENIDKLATSKTVMERLSTSIAKSLSDMVRESFREALFDSVVPVMEKTHAQIFKQINQAFQNGTKEFAANTEAAARAAAERGGAAATASLRAALERHAEALATAHSAAHHQHLADVIRETAHSVLEKELCWWREQARSAALASRAHSPSTPHSHHAADRQMQVAQIQSLIASGDVNGAFQQALSASDLALVMCACRAAEPSHVFGPPCKLKQHVLLSLVQQLAADMGRDTPLKHRYLEEAVMNLDTTNPVTREHLPAVVRELQKQLMAFLSATPNHALARQLRMLLMATEALVKAAA
ncbi:hypothetical protein B5X24_HaOG210568 [Helicoverpa armigera]|uniref:Uncharacterized protein n=1 Tax=Helicoverpa armigera TaxID=29058 RepID=A0A2W1BGH7_HELAM|nr:hypothetical protein B5X24_HaOG210568 [Helicoverpa armigera]